MDAHANVAAVEGHNHPGPATYFKIGLVLFVLTGLEVAAYELAHRGGTTEQVLRPVVVPILLVLSALKFALVAAFYMHLKNDHRAFTGLFASGLVIAAVIIVALMLLMSYHLTYNQGLV